MMITIMSRLQKLQSMVLVIVSIFDFQGNECVYIAIRVQWCSYTRCAYSCNVSLVRVMLNV